MVPNSASSVTDAATPRLLPKRPPMKSAIDVAPSRSTACTSRMISCGANSQTMIGPRVMGRKLQPSAAAVPTAPKKVQEVQ